tara:strand:- start:3505 stop:3753 length:249 start_codon:yes stop_codon:yes gene_type:complete
MALSAFLKALASSKTPAAVPAIGGSGLCEEACSICPKAPHPAHPCGAKEEIMKPANIALLITAAAQFITALAAVIAVIRGSP